MGLGSTLASFARDDSWGLAVEAAMEAHFSDFLVLGQSPLSWVVETFQSFDRSLSFRSVARLLPKLLAMRLLAVMAGDPTFNFSRLDEKSRTNSGGRPASSSLPSLSSCLEDRSSSEAFGRILGIALNEVVGDGFTKSPQTTFGKSVVVASSVDEGQ